MCPTSPTARKRFWRSSGPSRQVDATRADGMPCLTRISFSRVDRNKLIKSWKKLMPSWSPLHRTSCSKTEILIKVRSSSVWIRHECGVAEVDAAWKDNASGSVTMASFAAHLNGTALRLLCETVASFNATFSSVHSESDMPLDRSQLVQMSKRILDAYQQCICRLCALSVARIAAESLSLPPRGMMRFPQETQDDAEINALKNHIHFGAQDLAQCLMSIVHAMQMVDSRLPEVDPVDLSQSLCRSLIEHHTILCFRLLIHRVIGTLNGIKKRTLDSQKSSGSILRGTYPSKTQIERLSQLLFRLFLQSSGPLICNVYTRIFAMCCSEGFSLSWKT